MKWKSVMIWTMICAGLCAGGVFGVRHLTSRQRKTANVVPVANVDQVLMYQAWGFDMDSEQMYGTIVSRNTQTVDLEIGDGKTLRTVNVETGDNVKAGDVLLQYNMDKKELEREAHDLDLQLAQLQLRRLENELEEIRRKNPSLFVDLEERLKTTASADVVLDDSTAEKSAAGSAGNAKKTDALIEDADKADVLIEDADKTDTLIEEKENLLLDEEEMTEADNLVELPDGIIGDGTSSDPLLVDGILSDSLTDSDLEDGILTDSGKSGSGEKKDGSFLSGAVGEILTDSAQSLILDDSVDELSKDTAGTADGLTGVLSEDSDSSLADGVLADGVPADDVLAEDTLSDGVLADGASSENVLKDDALADGVLKDGVSAEEDGQEKLLELGEGETEDPVLKDSPDGNVPSGIEDGFDGEASAGIINGAEEEVVVDEAAGDTSEDGGTGNDPDISEYEEEEEDADSDEDGADNYSYVGDELSDDEDTTVQIDDSVDDEENQNEDLYSMYEDAEDESEAEDLGLPEADNSLSDSYSGSGFGGTTDITEESLDIQNYLKTFLSIANLLTQQFTSGTENLMDDDLEQARILYTKRLAREAKVHEFTDALGETRSVSLFLPSRNTIRALKEMEEAYSDFSASDTLRAVHQAYANYLYYRLCWEMYQIEQASETPVEEWTQETAETFEKNIREVLDTWYELYFFWRYLKETVPELAKSDSVYTELPDVYLDELKTCLLSFVTKDGDKQISDADFARYPILGGDYSGLLSLLVNLYNANNMIEEGTEKLDLEAETEDDTDYDDEDYDDDEGDGEEAETPEELRDMFFEKMMSIRSQRLIVREAELKLKQDDDEIEKATVRATIDGVVRSAKTLEEGKSSEEAFVVVAGEKGMYACGSISELERDTVKIGDTLTGTNEDTGVTFTATVTEISDYPASSSDDFFFYNYSSELTNSNASDYPFYAYIEDAEGLEEGSATMQFDKKMTESAAGVLLESYFVVDENGGRHYVLVAGEDGLLEKRYVTIGPNPYGYGSMITEGLTDDDLIAFPYENGSLRPEGESVREVDSLDEELY